MELLAATHRLDTILTLLGRSATEERRMGLGVPYWAPPHLWPIALGELGRELASELAEHSDGGAIADLAWALPRVTELWLDGALDFDTCWAFLGQVVGLYRGWQWERDAPRRPEDVRAVARFVRPDATTGFWARAFATRLAEAAEGTAIDSEELVSIPWASCELGVSCELLDWWQRSDDLALLHLRLAATLGYLGAGPEQPPDCLWWDPQLPEGAERHLQRFLSVRALRSRLSAARSRARSHHDRMLIVETIGRLGES